jgi:tellurite resistance protein TehA-like permease
MTPTRWILVALIGILIVGSIYVGSNPEMSARYSQSIRDAQLSSETKDLVMGGLAILVGGYLAWFLLVRRG